MEQLDIYTINFRKLKKGLHEFKFSPGNSFFENYEKSKIKHCKSNVKVKFNKQKKNFFKLDFLIHAEVELACDRCLDEFSLPINKEFHLLVRLTADLPENDDVELVFIKETEDEINIAQYIYEFFNLSLPIKKTCELGSKDCNPKVTKLINKHTAGNRQTDPRWEQLKKFYKN